MTCQTSEYRIIIGIGVTICARSPFTLVFSAVNWEVQAIMVKGCRCPVVFIVTGRAVSWEVGCYVIGIGGSLVFAIVAAITSIRRVIVIAIMALSTIIGNGSMGTIQWIIIIVNCKGRRSPTWGCGMAACTICRQTEGSVVGVDSGCKIGIMAAITFIWCIAVAAAVTLCTVISDGGMGTC
jgi:hypothetical protein